MTHSYNIDLEPLGLCNSEPLKQSRSSLSQMFFKIGSLKKFVISTGKETPTQVLLLLLFLYLNSVKTLKYIEFT